MQNETKSSQNRCKLIDFITHTRFLLFVNIDWERTGEKERDGAHSYAWVCDMVELNRIEYIFT